MSGRVAYLLDTNLLSETRKPNPDRGVIRFLEAAESSALFISVLTLGELRKGIAAKRLKDPDPLAASRLATWVDGLEQSFADRLIGVDAATAKLWGDLSGDRPRPVVDTLLAATAVLHDLTLVTRNIRDVRGTPVKLLDPWVE
jgi:predicted nucleic acid-binding protein